MNPARRGNMKKPHDRISNNMRWTARIIGLIIGLIWLSQVPGILEFSNIPLPLWIQAALLITPMVGVLIAWRWEAIGGAILIIGAILFVTLPNIAFAAAGREIKFGLSGVLILLPILVAGILFLICWRRSKSSKTQV
jgi:hypothetical protein